MAILRRFVAKVASSKISSVLSSFFTGFDSQTFGDNIAAGEILLHNLRLKDSIGKTFFSGINIDHGLGSS
jgi:hypothetical protein